MLSLVSDQALWRSWFSFLILPSLAFAKEKALFEKLEKQPLDFLQVADRLQSLPEPTEDWLDLLVSQGFLTKKNRLYGLTPLASVYLLSTSSYDWSLALRYAYQPMKRHCPVRQALYEREKIRFWKRLTHHPSIQDAFMGAMDAHVSSLASMLVEDPIFYNFQHIMEWGAGSGRLARELLRAHPKLTMTLVDLESSAKSAQALFDFTPYEDRLKWIYGDVQQLSLPLTEAIWMSHFIHHFDKDELQRLLARAKGALLKGGMIGIVDLFKTEETIFEISAFSLHLAQSASHSLWKLTDLIALVEGSGFKVERCQKIGALHHQIQARSVDGT